MRRKRMAAGNARRCCYLEEAGMNSLARGIHPFQAFFQFEAMGGMAVFLTLGHATPTDLAAVLSPARLRGALSTLLQKHSGIFCLDADWKWTLSWMVFDAQLSRVNFYTPFRSVVVLLPFLWGWGAWKGKSCKVLRPGWNVFGVFGPGFFPSSLLGLYLVYGVDFDSAVAGGAASCFGTLLTVALFLSKRIRCLWILFVISIFMKKSRNLLLTAGMSIVVLNNIRNTLHNLKSLVMSMTCNLKAKKESIIGPFRNYIEMLKTIGRLLKGIT
ncbi:Dendritic cell-specific transmembrane protein [Oryzias melastigma]|uniref:Dendritic cell-specific transmembrane protein n=1 Tax=Oryzias melastigma TaxID=30732 RepID=A0A834CI68_ORYME|nr:Dendritic cell-specific transmembrane protein [Oryzias melastigma]